MIFIMLIKLYTSRVILQALGIEDYGIYNLVGGITAMFSFVNGALTDASQRYITFEIGKGADGNVNKIFSTCLILHFLLAIIVVICAEPIGLWFLSNKLNIPADRLSAATWVFHLSLASMFVLFISVPYNALIIAHEKMKAFALISIITALINLSIAYALFLSKCYDRLILYGILLLVLQLITRVIYAFYCKRSFEESVFHFMWDKKLVKEIMKFISWTLIGNMSYVAYTQGLNLLLGMFFTPVVNAARGIAVQVQQAVNNFVKSFQTAINPQITKTYAAGQLDETHSLIFKSTRISSFLMMLPLIPIVFETPTLLNLWLVEVPDNTVIFLRIILITTWINALAKPLGIASLATGKIRLYEGTVATLKLLILPIAYFCLKMGFPAFSVFIVHFCIECITYTMNILISRHLVHFSLRQYIKEVLFKLVIVTTLALVIPIVIYFTMQENIVRFFVLSFASVCTSLVVIYYFGLTNGEKQFVISKVSDLKTKFKHKR